MQGNLASGMTLKWDLLVKTPAQPSILQLLMMGQVSNGLLWDGFNNLIMD